MLPLSTCDSHRVVLSLVDDVDLVGSTEEELKMRKQGQRGDRRKERGLKSTSTLAEELWMSDDTRTF